MLASVPGVVWLLLGMGLILALAITYGPALAEAWAKQRAIGRCEDIRAELEEARATGGDGTRVAQLTAELTSCTQESQTYGAEASVSEVTVASCRAMWEAMNAKHASFAATDRSDIIKRQNLRGELLQLGVRLVACLQQALAEAVNEAPLFSEATRLALFKNVRAVAVRALADSEARVRCYETNPACGRYDGSLETSNGDKMRDEQAAIGTPLRAVLADVDQRIAELSRSQGATTALLGSDLLRSSFDFGGAFIGGIA